jgi:hypothetical protein
MLLTLDAAPHAAPPLAAALAYAQVAPATLDALALAPDALALVSCAATRVPLLVARAWPTRKPWP